MKNINIDALYEEHLLQTLATTVRVIGSIIPANTEIVLHDLRKPALSIVEIANAHVTGRKKGDSVLAGMRTDKAFVQAMETSAEPITFLLDYETYTHDGSPLRSSSVFYRGQNTLPFAALCVNVDTDSIKNALHILQQLIGHIPQQTDSIALEKKATTQDNIEDLMRDIISNAKKISADNGHTDRKSAKLYAVKEMQNKGIFLMKGGVEKAATVLGVTRYTIYNYLDELKKSNP